jgi:hypothetical protein
LPVVSDEEPRARGYRGDRGIVTAFCALLTNFSTLTNESLDARTFGTCTLRLFDGGGADLLLPARFPRPFDKFADQVSSVLSALAGCRFEFHGTHHVP